VEASVEGFGGGKWWREMVEGNGRGVGGGIGKWWRRWWRDLVEGFGGGVGGGIWWREMVEHGVPCEYHTGPSVLRTQALVVR
jgi:hypothetical protein